MSKRKRLIYFDDFLWGKLKKRKENTGASISYQMRKAVTEYLRKLEKRRL